MGAWIKFYVQTIDNEVWQNDPTAWRVFEYLLLRAYSGQPQGTVRTSRQQIANYIHKDNGTTWKALLRLEKCQMVDKSSNNKFTTIRICNWKKYQQNGNSSEDNKRTTKGQQKDTLIRIKNKNIDNIDTNVSILAKADNRVVAINEMFDYWQATTQLPIASRLKANRYACSNLLKRHGEEKLHQLIRGVAASQADRYAPRIADFCELQQKLSALLLWGKGQANNQVEVIS